MGLFNGLSSVFGSFGTIPDIIMGKDPKEAFLDNLKTAALLGTAAVAGPAVFGAAGAGAGAAGSASAGGGLLGGGFGGATLGTGSAQLGTGAGLGMGSAASGTLAPNVAGSMLGTGPMSTAAAGVNGPGMFAQGMDMFNKVAKPAGQAMDMYNQFAPEDQPPIPAPQLTPPTSSPVFSNIMQMQQQTDMDRMQEELKRREQMRQRIAMMGGR